MLLADSFNILELMQSIPELALLGKSLIAFLISSAVIGVKLNKLLFSLISLLIPEVFAADFDLSTNKIIIYFLYLLFTAPCMH